MANRLWNKNIVVVVAKVVKPLEWLFSLVQNHCTQGTTGLLYNHYSEQWIVKKVLSVI